MGGAVGAGEAPRSAGDGATGPVAAQEGEPCLIMRVGGWLCALPARCVVETMRPLPRERLGGAPAFVLGIAIIRGAPTPVIDLRLLLATGSPAPPGRLVTLRVGRRQVAAAVDAVLDVRPVSRPTLAQLPPLLSLAGADAVEQVAAADRQLLLVLDPARLLSADDWEALQQGKPLG